MSEGWVPPDHRSDNQGMQRRVARGMTWTLIDSWGSQILGLVVFLVLVGLLRVEDIGLVALAATFVGLVQLFVDQGLGDALVQRSRLTRLQIDTAFWAAIVTGALLTLLGILVAPLIAALVGEPRLGPILQVLSLTFLLTALSSIQTALLRRDMRFKSLAIRRLLAVAVGGAVGIALAYANAGAWALVGQQLAAAAISVLTLWTISPWRPSRAFSFSEFKSLFSFGINIVGGDLLFFISRNIDNLLIGVFMGPISLGFYSVGYRFLDTSTTMFVNAARKVVFPAFARLQHDTARMRSGYTRITRIVGGIILPGYIGLTLVANEAVVVLVGVRWAEAGQVAAILFLIGPVLTLQAFSGSVLNAVGHPEVTLRFRFLTMVANVIGFLIAVLVFQSIVAVAAAYVIRGYLLLPVILYWQRKYAGIPIAENFYQLRGIAAATLVMVGALLGVKVLASGRASDGVLLASEIVTGILVYTVALVVFDRNLVRDTWRLARQAVPGGDRIGRLLPPTLGSRPRRTGAGAPATEPTIADDFDDV